MCLPTTITAMNIYVPCFICSKSITITRLLTAMLFLVNVKKRDFQMKKLMKVVLTSTHKICFRAEIRKSFTPVNLHFPNIKWDLQGCSYHRLVKR